jgi:non-specific serine/threonine protein kinase
VDELGRGGMGVVYRASDPALDRHVALKILPDHLARNETWLAQFQSEARLLAALNHPNIATIYSLEESDGAWFLTMELIPGEDLFAYLSRGRPPLGDALSIGRQIARALEAAHAQQIVHRDLKPSNVVITSEGHVKVLDFGLAARWDPGRPQDGPIAGGPDRSLLAGMETGDPETLVSAGTKVSGTPGYMSPEQLRGEAPDPRSDIFAFGCLLYECLTGAPAFGGPSVSERIRATFHAAPDLARLPDETPPAVRGLLQRCLSREAAARPARIEEARRELEEILAVRPWQGSEPAPPAAGAPNNLPQELSSFVGRTAQIDEIRALLETDRLVTLTGAGGCGKTRLSLRVARALLDRFPDGVWVVPLAGLTDSGLLARSVMTAAGIGESPSRTFMETLVQAFQGARSLIVLDNCEHMVEACAGFAAELLTGTARVRVLATSREALGIAGERAFHVPPLGVPGSGSAARDRPPSTPRPVTTSDVDAARGFESVQLFEQRARQVRPDFAVTPENLAAVLDVCRRLDGLPLALELAAARTRALDVSQIRDRLDDRFRMLTGGSRGAVAHHQTLRDLIDWSYQHLLDGEKKLFARLSVFSAGWSLEGMEAVCGGDGLEEWELLDILSRLIDKSLVEMESRAAGSEGAGGTRYRMLESVREFAQGALAEAEAEATRRRFRDYYIDLAQRSVTALIGPEQRAWLSRMDSEYDNFRTAIRMTLAERPDCKPALRLTGALQRYWMLRSNWSEPLAYLRTALSLPGAEARTVERGAALSALGNLLRLSGGSEEALGHFREAIEIFEETGAVDRLATGYNNLGGTYLTQLKPAEAMGPLERSLELSRRAGDEWMIAAVLTNMGNGAEALGDFQRVRTCQEEALALFQKLGDRVHSAYAVMWLGVAAFRLEEYHEALRRYDEAVAIADEMGDRWLRSIVLVNRASVTMALGRTDESRATLRESILISAEMDDPTGLVAAVEDFAEIASREGRLDFSVRIRAGCEVLRRERQSPRRPLDEERVEGEKAEIRAKLGDAAYEAAEREGAALSKEELLRLVLGEG